MACDVRGATWLAASAALAAGLSGCLARDDPYAATYEADEAACVAATEQARSFEAYRECMAGRGWQVPAEGKVSENALSDSVGNKPGDSDGGLTRVPDPDELELLGSKMPSE